MSPRNVQLSRKFTGAADAISALEAMGAEVFQPQEAEEPILAVPVRRAVREWLVEISAADELKSARVEPRSTALLYGPPGTGKTTLAHHLAARLGVPLISLGAEAICSPYPGEAEQAIANFFSAARQIGRGAVFLIDELKALGGHRDKNTGGGADNGRTSQLGVLLRKIERFRGVLVGATNRPDDIDPALWRRFGMQICVALPEDEERFAILKRYAAPFDLGEKGFDSLSAATAGASPSLLRQLMESMKRRLVLAHRLSDDVSDAGRVFSNIVAGISPPREMGTPAILRDEHLTDDLSSVLTWPPTRTEAAE